jgi:hypothetical protein
MPPEAATPAVPDEHVGGSFGIGTGGMSVGALLTWACVGIPIAWGGWLTLKQALILFG